jgi:hypothetical protein
MPDARLRKLLAQALRAPTGNTDKTTYERMMANPANQRVSEAPIVGAARTDPGPPTRSPMKPGQLQRAIPGRPGTLSMDSQHAHEGAQAVTDPIIGKEREHYQRQMMLAELEASLNSNERY